MAEGIRAGGGGGERPALSISPRAPPEIFERSQLHLSAGSGGPAAPSHTPSDTSVNEEAQVVLLPGALCQADHGWSERTELGKAALPAAAASSLCATTGHRQLVELVDLQG